MGTLEQGRGENSEVSPGQKAALICLFKLDFWVAFYLELKESFKKKKKSKSNKPYQTFLSLPFALHGKLLLPIPVL